jgi:hypothetical protein
MNESFESLDTYKPSGQKIFVNEALVEAKGDDDGTLGSIIDRGLSFVPRAMRFKKAKKVMKKSLEAYTKKAKNLINKFSSSLSKKVNKIESEYKKFKQNKLKPLLEAGKREEAVKLAKEQLKELEEYKKEQFQTLNKSIESVLESYTSSINNRIDNPGFVLNVELSGRGKGELKAKWQELAAIQNTKIDEYKTNIVKSEGIKKLDDIISELTGFVEERRHSADADVVFNVHDIVPKEGGEYLIRIHLRVSGGRPEVEEKGVLIGENPEDMEIGESGVRKVKEVGTYQYNARPYKLVIKGRPDEFVKPYMIVKNRVEPYYGDAASLDVREKSGEEKLRGDVTVSSKRKEPEKPEKSDKKSGGDLSGEESMK